jgi:nitrate reductase NapAB chaperone NapD
MGFHGNPLQKNLSTQLWTHGDCYVNLNEERRKCLVTLDQEEKKRLTQTMESITKKLIN